MLVLWHRDQVGCDQCSCLVPLFGHCHLRDKVGVPVGLIHTSYGGSAVEDWVSKQVLGDGKSGPCPGPIVGSMGLPNQQYNGMIRPLTNMTIKVGAVSQPALTQLTRTTGNQ